MREIALDTETTGLDPYSGHRIVEIGAVELINTVRTGNHFHVYLNPERDMPREAENIHGLSMSFLSDKPKFREIARSFLEFIADSPLVIHNAAFDLKFLNAELDVQRLPIIDAARATDTVLIARKKFPGSPANLDALCKRFSIDTSARTKHGALLDAELLADVYLELKGGRQTTLGALMESETSTHNAQRTTNTEALEFTGHTDMPQRAFPPTPDELAAHKAATDKIKNALWNMA